MQAFWYVYILESEREGDHFYVGLAENVKARIGQTQCGRSSPYLKIPAMEDQNRNRLL